MSLFIANMSECTRSSELQTVGLRKAIAQNLEVKMQLHKILHDKCYGK